jgi:hypothetical protein
MNPLSFPQIDADRMFNELGDLRVELDDDPLVFGPKRLNSKTAQVRRMLDRCETLFLDVSRKLQSVRRAMRVAQTDFDLAKKDLFANDPETRSGRSVSDREAIAAGKLETEIRCIHELNLAAEDLDAVLVVIKAKRADLKDTEGRLRDQIRLCSEEIGLGGRWGSKVPNAPDLYGRPALKLASGADVEDVTDLIQGLDGEIQLSRDLGNWTDPEDMSVDVDVVKVEVAPTPAILSLVEPHDPPSIVPESQDSDVDGMTNAIMASLAEGGISDASPTENPTPPEEIHLDDTPSVAKDMESSMAATTQSNDVDMFLEDVTVSAALMPKPNLSKIMDEIDMDSILDMFEIP